MLESLFEKFFENLLDRDPIDKEKFSKWIEEVAEKITEVAVEINDDKLIDTILEDTSFNFFEGYYDTLVMMFKEDMDIEKSAYEILNIMMKNKKKNES